MPNRRRPSPLARLGTRGRIVLLAVAAALPTICFAAYLMLQEEATVKTAALYYGTAAVTAVVLVVVVAWVGAERLVLAPIRTMLDAARRVSAGDLTARTRMEAGNEELSQLGAGLDAMADRLESRDRELRRVLAELQRQALTDPLTGLYNRRFFWDALTRESVEARRTGAAFSVIMLDIDHFKRVNDSLGHDAGDFVLREVGAAIARSIRESDIAARYGGEEFAILMPNTTVDVAAERADALRRHFHELCIRYEEQPIAVTISLGVAESSMSPDAPGRLMRAVDEAMYEAKSRGRDRVVVSADGHMEQYPAAPAPVTRATTRRAT